MAAEIHTLKLCSALMQYPREEILEAVGGLEANAVGPLKRRQARSLDSFLDWYSSHTLTELERAYVECFDFNRRCSLHLTYHLHGDSRQRGLALAKIKSAYREAGHEISGTELPDYLPLMLEFAAIAPGDAGLELLDSHRESLELIREGLADGSSPFESLLEIVISFLPRLSSRQAKRIKRLALEGPPSEQVGLEPFAPPEVMPTGPGEEAEPLVGGRS